MRRFAVLDRDGTIVVERDHLTDPAELELEAGAAEGLRRLAALDLGLVVITNQSAVGRGLLNLPRLQEIHRSLDALLAAEGVRLDGIYFCPHTPEDDCDCRKPRTALLERAAREHSFDPAESFVIGDKTSDIELGRRTGATTFLVSTGYGAMTARDASVTADHRVADLTEAARRIASLLPGPRRSEPPALGEGDGA